MNDQDRKIIALEATVAQQAKMIEHLRGGPTPLYTAVDMANAARDGFRDGAESVEPIKAFANEITSAAFEGGSFDGGDIQDMAVKHGLMRIENRAEECCEGCQCREYGFPAECYRKTELLTGGSVKDE